MSLVDFLAKGVQHFTGEDARREIVKETKEVYAKGREEIEELVNKFNNVVSIFNKKILSLNEIRKDRLSSHIENLSNFLSNFGNVKDMSEFSKEKEKGFITIPDRAFEEVENYIENVDWSSDEVFMRTFFSGGIFAAITTRKQNIKMLEKLEELRNDIMDAKDKLNNRIKMLKVVDIRICDLYIKIVNKICDYITTSIEPEFKLIISFLECESIKNTYISNSEVKEISNVVYQRNILLYNDTIYQKHYNFVRNSFWFYILAATMYSSPVLTKLLENKKLSKKDIEKLEKQETLCDNQILLLEENRI